ncbi:MAG: MATE family efflux transporter [Ruminococcus sp.]
MQVKIKGFHLQKQMIRRIFAFGLPSFIMNALSSFMVTFVNLFLVAYSDTAIAFFGAYFKVQQLIVMTVNGLIQGCLPVMRFNYGAGNSERLHSAFRYGTALVTGMMILGTLAVILFPAQILGLFTASEAMRSFGISAMRIMATSYLFCGLSTMISTYFQATEKVGSSMAIQLCRQMLFLVPCLMVSGQIVPSERNLACIPGRGNCHFARCSCDDGMASTQKYLITCFAKEEL